MTRSRRSREVEAGWQPVENQAADQAWRSMIGDEVPPPTYWRKGPLLASVSRDPIGGDFDDLRWHISMRWQSPVIEDAGRVPTWEELVQAAHELRPGVVFCIPVPPRSWWINVHPDVLHMHEIKDPALVAQWRAERAGDRPT